MDLLRYVQDTLMDTSRIPEFSSGDTIVVSYKIIEGNKERIQDYRGDVINVRGEGKNKTFTVRKVSSGVGVERIFPFSSPNIAEIKVVKKDAFVVPNCFTCVNYQVKSTYQRTYTGC